MDKDTTSGTEYREFYCLKCSWQKEEDRGPALWKVLEDEDEIIARAVLAVERLPEIDRQEVRAVFDRDWTPERLVRQLDATYRRRLSEPRKLLSMRTLRERSLLFRKIRRHYLRRS